MEQTVQELMVEFVRAENKILEWKEEFQKT